jgi:hypothetical protein
MIMNKKKDLEDFRTVALFSLSFECKKCGARMSDKGVKRKLFSDEWYDNLAKKAYKEGWLVLNEYEALCPDCGMKKQRVIRKRNLF